MTYVPRAARGPVRDGSHDRELMNLENFTEAMSNDARVQRGPVSQRQPHASR